jgi:peptide/nickel transport system substrate-binding protein
MTRETNYWRPFLARRLSRRRALQAAALGSAGLATAVAVACRGKEGKEVVPAPTTGPEGEPGRPVLGGTTRGTGGGIPGLDPLITGFFLTQVYASYPYSRIVRYKTVTGKLDPSEYYAVVPDLAMSWENPDPLTYIFTLRPEAKWHAVDPIDPLGRQVTVEDVLFSWNRYNSESPQRGNLSMVDRLEGNPDTRQLTFKLKSPFGLFLTRLASFQDLWIMPPELIEVDGDGSKRMVGSGPYIFDVDKFRRDVGLFFRKNPDYWETDSFGNHLPYVDATEILVIADKNQELSQYRAGQLDTMYIPPPLLDAFRSENPDSVVTPYIRNLLSFLYVEPASYTANQPPFNDVRVRRALSMALDRDLLLEVCSPEKGEWPNVINTGMGLWWLDPRSPEMGDAGQWYQYNLEESKKLLEAAGFADGFDVAFHFGSTGYGTVIPYYDTVWQVLPDMLRQVGIRLQSVPEEYNLYFEKTFYRGDFDGIAWGLESVFTDVAAYLGNMLLPRDMGAERNHSGVSDPSLTALIQQMMAEQDPERIRQLSFEVQRLASDQMYYIPGVSVVEFSGRHPWIHNAQNVGGPTTYAVGTEGGMYAWKSTA